MPKVKQKTAHESVSEKKLVPGQWKKEIESGGMLHGPSTLFMACAVGDATDPETGEKFELLCQGWGPGAPLIRCPRTGLQFTLSWHAIVNLAVAAGITREHPDMEDK